jgi:hypothetical protein
MLLPISGRAEKRRTRVTIALVWLVLALPIRAESRGHKLFRWSIAAVTVGNGLDAASSYGQSEANPVLAQRGQFQTGSVVLKFGIVGGVIAAEGLLLRKHPDAAKPAALINFGMAGAFTGAAVRNWKAQGGF